MSDPIQLTSAVDNNATAATSASASLTCCQVLSPPTQKVGPDHNAIVYPLIQTAWQCTFSRDGRWLVACFGAPHPCVRVWRHILEEITLDKNDAAAIGRFELHSTLSGLHDRTIRSVAVAPIVSGPLILATASFDGTVAIWEQPNNNNNSIKGEETHEVSWDCIAQLEGHDNEVKCVCWNATGSLLGTCGRDKTVWIWECFLPGTVGGSALHADGGDFECIAVLHGHEGDVKCIAFCPSHGQWGDGDEILLSASYDETIKCWAEDAGDWYCVVTLPTVHTATIWSLALSPSGMRLISGAADGSLAIYKCYYYKSVEEKKKVLRKEEQEDSNNKINVTVDNARFDDTKHRGLWKCVGRLEHAHHDDRPIYSVAHASARAGHGCIASGGGDHCIRIYREVIQQPQQPDGQYSTDRPLFALETCVTTSHGDVNCVCWHPLDGSILASAGDDGTVRIWKYKPSRSLQNKTTPSTLLL